LDEYLVKNDESDLLIAACPVGPPNDTVRWND